MPPYGNFLLWALAVVAIVFIVLFAVGVIH